jgi:hypothetical protein
VRCGAVHPIITAPDQCCINVEKGLADQRRPHMTLKRYVMRGPPRLTDIRRHLATICEASKPADFPRLCFVLVVLAGIHRMNPNGLEQSRFSGRSRNCAVAPDT